MIKVQDSFSSVFGTEVHRSQSFRSNKLIPVTHSRTWIRGFFYSDDFNNVLQCNWTLHFMSLCWNQNC